MALLLSSVSSFASQCDQTKHANLYLSGDVYSDGLFFYSGDEAKKGFDAIESDASDSIKSYIAAIYKGVDVKNMKAKYGSAAYNAWCWNYSVSEDNGKTCEMYTCLTSQAK
jgi:hypothetical protein